MTDIHNPPTRCRRPGAAWALPAAFVAIERRCSDPLLPLRSLRGRDLGTGGIVLTTLAALGFSPTRGPAPDAASAAPSGSEQNPARR
ncbi:hypothetical protein [Streptosporangium sp. CA-115845]|uniref:hypothetical protein n=1 Tax=Streptosporangium sp. CA-115845 TaxID=3240071 RepID=UPI003D91BA8E